MSRGIKPEDFNSYGVRRGNDLVMTRGTFANVRIKNLMVPGVEGGVTIHQPERRADVDLRRGDEISETKTAARSFWPGRNTAPAQSRDWAAKGTRLLGVKAVVAASFERIHRSNLVGMGVLPLQFIEGTNAQSLGLDGSRNFCDHRIVGCDPAGRDA